ncbi:MAG TPA: hypothetical protein VHB98_08880, partial [Chloroflexota bacterium]|nr:hypothetical protein [Chloroflexota bacterium]
MHRSPWRVIATLGVAASLFTQMQGTPIGHAAGLPQIVKPSSLSPAQARQLSQHVTQKVIIILQNQHTDLPATSLARAAAVRSDQSTIQSELSAVGARAVLSYSLINAIAATVSPLEVSRLQTNPLVRAVVPDLTIRANAPHLTASTQDGTASTVLAAQKGAVASASTVTPACERSVQLEPEALQLINAVSTDPSAPQAQQLTTPDGTKITGKGVKVALIAGDL